MSWVRMRFKDQQVWVLSDESGRPVLDSEGRAEMKYRETDSKSYRPSPNNLLPGDGTVSTAVASEAKPAPKKRAPQARGSSSAEGPGSSATGHGSAVQIWTDGACSGNPGPMGIGVVVIDGAARRELGEYLGTGTNNIAELTAIERGVELAVEVTGGDRERRLRVYSDSSYAIGLLDKGWKAKANQELVARLKRKLAGLQRIEFVKVSGHAGVPENERCDELAREAVVRRASVR